VIDDSFPLWIWSVDLVLVYNLVFGTPTWLWFSSWIFPCAYIVVHEVTIVAIVTGFHKQWDNFIKASVLEER